MNFDEDDIIAIDSEGKEYEVLYSSISGNGREFYFRIKYKEIRGEDEYKYL